MLVVFLKSHSKHLSRTLLASKINIRRASAIFLQNRLFARKHFSASYLWYKTVYIMRAYRKILTFHFSKSSIVNFSLVWATTHPNIYVSYLVLYPSGSVPSIKANQTNFTIIHGSWSIFTWPTIYLQCCVIYHNVHHSPAEEVNVLRSQQPLPSHLPFFNWLSAYILR